MVTTAGWSRRNENVVPRGRLRAVLPVSGVACGPTLKSEFVCDSTEIVAAVADGGGGGVVPAVVPPGVVVLPDVVPPVVPPGVAEQPTTVAVWWGRSSPPTLSSPHDSRVCEPFGTAIAALPGFPLVACVCSDPPSMRKRTALA